MSEQVTALPEAVAARRCGGAGWRSPASAASTRGCAPSRSAPGFPLLLVLLWHFAVAYTGTRLVPSPRQVAVMMYDFTFGGIYDDAFSAHHPHPRLEVRCSASTAASFWRR